MGYQNAARVYANWGHLAHRPFRMLAYMAMLSHDHDEHPVYFGGWEAPSVAIGYPLTPSEGHTDDTPHREISQAGHDAVKADVATLRAAGAITPAPKTAGRRRKRYALQLCPPEALLVRPRRGDNSPTRPPRRGTSAPRTAGDLSTPATGGLSTPYTEWTGLTEMTKNKSPQVTASPAPGSRLWTTRLASAPGVVMEDGRG